ncbi:MAG: PHB depolymerase family esterase [Bacteroidota bacterium]
MNPLSILITISLLTSVGLSSPSKVADNSTGDFYLIKKEYPNTNVDGYNLYVPKSCNAESEAFPVIMFFHGGSSVGGGKVDVVYERNLAKYLKETSGLESEIKQLRLNTFVYIIPHISEGQFYHGTDAYPQIIAEVAEQYNIDGDRVYLTGLSRGGHGTWGVASRIPEHFAAVAPLCGAQHGVEVYEGFKDLPLWTAHNLTDQSIMHAETQGAVEKIEAINGVPFHHSSTVKEADYQNHRYLFTSGSHPVNNHNAWSEVYTSVEFYKWLLRFKREE